MVRVEIKANATIAVDGNYIEVPVVFTTFVKDGDKIDMKHEVYQKLKDASLGWNAGYEVNVLD